MNLWLLAVETTEIGLPVWAVTAVVGALVTAIAFLSNRYISVNNKLSRILENHASVIKEMANNHADELAALITKHSSDLASIIERTTTALVKVVDITENHTEVLKELTQLIRDLRN